jgi:O-acetyl-ADP-ribose deacetylase (regulator of RNase III)
MRLLKRRFRVVQESPTRGSELLLVCSASTTCRMDRGEAGAVDSACGLGFEAHVQHELVEQHGGPMEPGDVLVTDAGAHPTACYVAHAALVDDREGIPSGRRLPDMERVAACCERLWPAIEAIDEFGSISVAMVALGAGAGELGVRLPTDLACRTLAQHLRTHPDSRIGDVTFYSRALLEHVNMTEVVASYFDMPPESVPCGMRRFLQRNTR